MFALLISITVHILTHHACIINYRATVKSVCGQTRCAKEKQGMML